MGQQRPALGDGAAAHHGEVADGSDRLVGLGLGTAVSIEGVLEDRRSDATLGEASCELGPGGVAVVIPRRHQHTHAVGRLPRDDLAHMGRRGIRRQEPARALEDTVSHGQAFVDHRVQPLDIDGCRWLELVGNHQLLDAFWLAPPVLEYPQSLRSVR